MTKGLDDIIANLMHFQMHAQKKARGAVSEVADMFAEELEKNTPRSDVAELGLNNHLEDEVLVTGFKGANIGVIAKDIGYGRKTGWRSHFPNDGTISQPSQEFKEKTINTMTPKAEEIYQKRMKEALKL